MAHMESARPGRCASPRCVLMIHRPSGNDNTRGNEMKVRDSSGQYLTDDQIIRLALQVLEHRFGLKRPALNSPATVREYLRLSLPDLEHEVFCVAFLDNQHRVLAFEQMFRGTVTQTSVYPREVIKRALAHNAAVVILAHNHPSGVAEPSCADEALTVTLRTALALVDVKVLDHFIISGANYVSFVERGLL